MQDFHSLTKFPCICKKEQTQSLQFQLCCYKQHQKMEMFLCQSSWTLPHQLLLKILIEMSGQITIGFNNKEPSLKRKKKYWRKMVGLHFSYVHHISFCIEAGSTKRKAKPAILRTDVIVLSTSACLAVESNDSASPQITRSCSLPPARTSWHVRSQFAVQWDTKQHLSQISLPPLSSFSQWFQLLQAKPKLKKVERGEKEKSQELKKACLNTEEWVINLHTVQRIDEF